MTKPKRYELRQKIREIQMDLKALTGEDFQVQLSTYNAGSLANARTLGKEVRKEFGNRFRTFRSEGHEWVRAENNNEKIYITIFK